MESINWPNRANLKLSFLPEKKTFGRIPTTGRKQPFFTFWPVAESNKMRLYTFRPKRIIINTNVKLRGVRFAKFPYRVKVLFSKPFTR